jgi:hypothetical protein
VSGVERLASRKDIVNARTREPTGYEMSDPERPDEMLNGWTSNEYPIPGIGSSLLAATTEHEVGAAMIIKRRL